MDSKWVSAMSMLPNGLLMTAFLATGVGGLATSLAAEPTTGTGPAGLPAMTLLGVIASEGDSAIALFRDSANGRTFGKKIGEVLTEAQSQGPTSPTTKGNASIEIAKWHIVSISRKAVTLKSVGGRTAIVDVGEQMGSDSAVSTSAARHEVPAPQPPRILFSPPVLASGQQDPAQNPDLVSIGADQTDLDAGTRRPVEQISSSLEWSPVVDDASLDAARDRSNGMEWGQLSPDHEDDPAADEDLLQRLLDRGIE